MIDRVIKTTQTPLEPGDPRLGEVKQLSSEINAVLAGQEVDTVLNAIAHVLADYLATQTENDRQALLDGFVTIVKVNTRIFAGEATA